MPFTFSHPAIILPLRFLPKKWFSLTGLIVGSMAPDFEYFLRMKLQGIYGHTLIGVFWFDLAFGIVLAFMFHNVVRDSLFDNLPNELKSRFIIFKTFDWNRYFKHNWIVVVYSLLIGTLSHLFWDSFTHETGYFVNYFPELQRPVCFVGKPIKIYKILQHGSTLLGALTISFALYGMPQSKQSDKKISIRYWLVLSTVTLVFSLHELY